MSDPSPEAREAANAMWQDVFGCRFDDTTAHPDFIVQRDKYARALDAFAREAVERERERCSRLAGQYHGRSALNIMLAIRYGESP